LKIYSFLSEHYESLHSNVIGATAGETPFVLDGLVGNAAEFDPLAYHVDTRGMSDHVFALFHLLGLSSAPRLRDFPDRRLTSFGRPGRWRALSAIMGRPVNEEVVLEHWIDVLRLTAGIRTLSLKPSSMSRKLGAYRQQIRRHPAVGEIGRIESSLFMPDWIECPNSKLRTELCVRSLVEALERWWALRKHGLMRLGLGCTDCRGDGVADASLHCLDCSNQLRP